MRKKKNTGLVLAIVAIAVAVGLLGWYLAYIFEGEKPWVRLEPGPEYLSAAEQFRVSAGDEKRGIRTLHVVARQGGREVSILEQSFPYKGLLNRKGMHEYEAAFSVDPDELQLAQGRLDLEVRVWDHSRRSGGDGNFTLYHHKMTVDTIPPSARAISRMHNVNMGGTGLAVYRVSADSAESGVTVNQQLFPGYPSGGSGAENTRVCYFAVPHDIEGRPEVHLWAKDKAGNESKTSLYCHIREKRFPTEAVNITDSFLEQALPYFAFYPLENEETSVGKFIKINRELRKESTLVFTNLGSKSVPERLWEGVWLRLMNAANMSQYAEHRVYYYRGEKIDEQVHLGVDLASLANSEIQAANHGRVIFADRNGIYGLTVVLDHGQGLASTYSHLSEITVALNQKVRRGEIIGYTGQTGLAGGDHLHFGVMVSGVFVNPIEWWDPHWIQDNVSRKLALLSGQQ